MYNNWTKDKIPKGMIVYRGWVIPKDLEDFMPPDELLDTLEKPFSVVYTHDGRGYDLFKHKYVRH